jgi:mono/diheme cytochrome c family protein
MSFSGNGGLRNNSFKFGVTKTGAVGDNHVTVTPSASLLDAGSNMTRIPAALPLFRFACAAIALFLGGSLSADDNADRDHFFETTIRPLLIENCQGCHNDRKQNGGLRLDSRDFALKGGDTSPAISLDRPSESLLLKAVRHEDGLEMPPKKQLTDEQIASLSRWIETGAHWPRSSPTAQVSTADRARNHWAFQPIQNPAPPVVRQSAWGRNEIDSFILAGLEAAGLEPSREADRRTLIRRAYFTLTGLPPSYDEVQRFVADDDPGAYQQLVERLLDSPQYGEHWARHWLDVARYSDTKGYVYAREERFWVHAWPYRDWVVRAFNDDMPYDRFLLLQLAADQVDDRRPDDLAAMGYLTLGRRFLGVKRDIIDDRIDVVCRGTMGLTVGCARCHDHKYDPIPTADYYSLYGVFDSCAEKMAPLPTDIRPDSKFRKELRRREKKLADDIQKRRAESGERVRKRVGDYLAAQFDLGNYPAEGFDQIFEATDLLPAFVHRWKNYLATAERTGDPVFVPWHAFARLSKESFAEQAPAVTTQLTTDGERINPIVLESFETPPASMAEVIDRYRALFQKIDERWQTALKDAETSNAETPTELDDPVAEQLRRVLYGAGAPCVVPDEPVVHIEYDVDSEVCDELWKLQGEVDRQIIKSSLPLPYALTLVDRETPSEPRIFKRGNPVNLGDPIPRHFLTLLSNGDPQPFQHGSGRLELAQDIIDPSNPLTARVIVNRVWARHFGEGIVSTPSDFGTRAEKPRHLDLLDWLASRLIAEKWSLKQLQRMILLSATFRQSSSDVGEMATAAMKVDPANRLLWRMNPRRLSFEEFRDSALRAGGELDLEMAGKPSELFKAPYPHRRTLYGLVDRQFLPGTLRIFDFANPDLHIPQRSETTVPQQALFVLNHPLMLERARSLAATVQSAQTDEAKVQRLFEAAYQRQPSPTQMQASLELVRAAEAVDAAPKPLTAQDWQYGYGTYDETAQKVVEFAALPHFTGDAWQGGAAWPDPTLGWVQLTANGGHPGNDRQHAAVRRWTAPRKTILTIVSDLKHEPEVGDGVRSFVVNSRTGLLQSAKAHHQTVETRIAQVFVEAGDTIDFVVDIDKELNTDQYLWSVKLFESRTSESPTTWNSQADFPRDTAAQLNGWEQLAQVLLGSNEFLFID